MESLVSSSKSVVHSVEEHQHQLATDFTNGPATFDVDVQAETSLEMVTELRSPTNSITIPINGLPDEVMFLIFELVSVTCYLSSGAMCFASPINQNYGQLQVDVIMKKPVDLHNISLVCQRWNSIASPILYRSMRISQPLLDIIRNEPIGPSVLRRIQAHSQQLSMIIYTKHPFTPLDWPFVSEIITGCRNLRLVR